MSAGNTTPAPTHPTPPSPVELRELIGQLQLPFVADGDYVRAGHDENAIAETMGETAEEAAFWRDSIVAAVNALPGLLDEVFETGALASELNRKLSAAEARADALAVALKECADAIRGDGIVHVTTWCDQLKAAEGRARQALSPSTTGEGHD